MKTLTFVEYGGKQIEEGSFIDSAKEVWAKEGNIIKDIVSMKLYVKPEENLIYYVINENFSGCFTLC